MNTALFRVIADRIEENPESYNQQKLCGSPCCVFGHAALLTGIVLNSGDSSKIKNLIVSIQVALGINRDDGEALFAPSWPRSWFERAGLELGEHRYYRDPYAYPLPHEAAIILRTMADQGSVQPKLSLIHI